MRLYDRRSSRKAKRNVNDRGCGSAETVIWLVVFGEVVIMYDCAFKTRRADVVIG